MNSYYVIEKFLNTDTEKKLLDTALEVQDWYQHFSSKSGEYTALKFYDPKLTFLGRKCWLMKLDPNEIVKEHVDGWRNTVLIYPLTENYAPCVTRQGKTSEAILLNSQQPHSVINNCTTRINLQILFDEDIDDTLRIFKNRTTNELVPSGLSD